MSFFISKTEPSRSFCQSLPPPPLRGITTPPTYASLLAVAIELSPDQRLLLDDMYKYIEDYRCLVPVVDHPNWKNSVRHNLSLRKCFVKVPRKTDKGKSLCAWWELKRAEVPKAAKEALVELDKLRKTAERTNSSLHDMLFEEFYEFMEQKKGDAEYNLASVPKSSSSSESPVRSRAPKTLTTPSPRGRKSRLALSTSDADLDIDRENSRNSRFTSSSLSSSPLEGTSPHQGQLTSQSWTPSTHSKFVDSDEEFIQSLESFDDTFLQGLTLDSSFDHLDLGSSFGSQHGSSFHNDQTSCLEITVPPDYGVTTFPSVPFQFNAQYSSPFNQQFNQHEFPDYGSSFHDPFPSNPLELNNNSDGFNF